jgi:hypothetical protein
MLKQSRAIPDAANGAGTRTALAAELARRAGGAEAGLIREGALVNAWPDT